MGNTRGGLSSGGTPAPAPVSTPAAATSPTTAVRPLTTEVEALAIMIAKALLSDIDDYTEFAWEELGYTSVNEWAVATAELAETDGAGEDYVFTEIHHDHMHAAWTAGQSVEEVGVSPHADSTADQGG